jgi:hypothetical protein
MFLSSLIYAQGITNTIRGRVTDKQSQFQIPGVKISIKDSNPFNGSVTNFEGIYEITNVPIGRLALEISAAGYETVTIPNLELKSGKELIINVGIEESIQQLESVTVTASSDKDGTLNKMATVSSRTISTEEAGKFAGTLNDPARMVQNYAGVSGGSDDRNDIIIRGNSPLGVLWRLEGIDIPSPNHFSTLGTTGGPVSMLNINNLSNSDFFTSAWSADYGNALSGVFDLRLRNGNNRKHEFLGQVGFNGFELGAEGPFSKKSNASYLINYRYSTLGIMSALGLDLGVGAAVPQYQDLTFKFNFPTKKAGRFNIWGIGGVSYIELLATEDIDSTNLFSDNSENSRFDSKTAVIGGSHKYFFNKNTFYELIIAYSLSNTTGSFDSLSNGIGSKSINVFGFDRTQEKLSTNLKLNHKINPKNTITFGIIAENYFTNIKDSVFIYDSYFTTANDKSSAVLFQSYINYQHKFNDKILFNGGVHSQHFLLTNSNVVEPRLGIKYKPNRRHTISIGSGIHSQLQPIPFYFNKSIDVNEEVALPNQLIDFSKAIHNVIGYDIQITEHTRLKTELYYQYLYNVPVDTLSSSFSMLNEGAGFVLPDGTGYTNDGTGYNYGAEITLERFLDRGFYYLLTTSLFNSKYTGSDGIERNTAFNGNFIINALAGKEFKIGKMASFGLDLRVTYAGGKRYTPINLDASILAGAQILDAEEIYESQLDNYFRTDFKLTFKLNGKKINQEFSVDLQNLTNQNNIFQKGYNPKTQKIGATYQRGFFPNVQYKINF